MLPHKDFEIQAISPPVIPPDVQGFLPELDPPSSKVAAVVVGADFEFNYYKLTKAANYLRQNPKCIFVATNPDPRALLGPGVWMVGRGSLLENTMW